MTGPGFTNMGRERAEFMAEQERDEERARRRIGLPSPALAKPSGNWPFPALGQPMAPVRRRKPSPDDFPDALF